VLKRDGGRWQQRGIVTFASDLFNRLLGSL
jgi:hypothetical protein